MTNAMTINEIREAVLNGDFEIEYMHRPSKLKENHVIDENQTVKWNKEEVARINAENKAAYDAYIEKASEMEDKMIDAIVTAYANDYRMSKARVAKVYSYAYSEGHSGGMFSGGMFEVFNEMNSMMDLISDVLETE